MIKFNRIYTLILVLVVLVVCACISELYFDRGIPFISLKQQWAIGIYVGKDPFNFSSLEDIDNPVLTYQDVTDVPAEFVADPFMIRAGSRWYMFFEVMNADTNQGDIGLAISNDGFNWEYKQIVLDELFHLAYPCVFEFDDEYYMIPDSREANSVRLYKAVNFPTEWSFDRILLKGGYSDPSIFRYNGKWWIFAEANPVRGSNDTLRLYYSNDLNEPFIEHPQSPIVFGDANIARPGGRVLVVGNRIIRYAQDDYPRYGNQVWAFEITELTTTSYKEKRESRNPILKASGIGWNKDGMHHIDSHQVEQDKWIACVDGFYRVIYFRFK